MMGITVVGVIALDTIITPFSEANNVLGGSAYYFALAAAQYQPVSVVAVVGTDLPEEGLTPLCVQGIDLAGVRRKSGTTFRWGARYHLDWNVRDTLHTDLGVLAAFQPDIPEHCRTAPIVFVANLPPCLQLEAIKQVSGNRLLALDTMDLWIDSVRDELVQVLSAVDIVFMTEEEVCQFAGTVNMYVAAQAVLDLGPRIVVIKSGRYGALLVDRMSGYFAAHAFPLRDVQDPTGAGDAFAGGFLGSLATVLAQGRELSVQDFKRALFHGNTLGSFACEALGARRLEDLTAQDIIQRYGELVSFTHIEGRLSINEHGSRAGKKQQKHSPGVKEPAVSHKLAS